MPGCDLNHLTVWPGNLQLPRASTNRALYRKSRPARGVGLFNNLPGCTKQSCVLKRTGSAISSSSSPSFSCFPSRLPLLSVCLYASLLVLPYDSLVFDSHCCCCLEKLTLLCACNFNRPPRCRCQGRKSCSHNTKCLASAAWAVVETRAPPHILLTKGNQLSAPINLTSKRGWLPV